MADNYITIHDKNGSINISEDVVTADDPREMMGIPAKSTFATEKGGAK